MTNWNEQKQAVGSAWWDAVENAPWQQLDDYTWAKEITCPNCHHKLEATETVAVRGLVVAPPRGVRRIECNCHNAHPDRADGLLGCGFYGEKFTRPGGR